jgi:hypothetical protein
MKRFLIVSKLFNSFFFKFVIVILMFVVLGFTHGVVHAESADDVLAETESKVTKRHIEALNLEIPEVTDNPNLAITFNPVADNETIKLQIDNGGYNKISSPYRFKSLTVGKHVLDFKYANESEIEQAFSIDLTVIPRKLRFGTEDSSQKQSFDKNEKVVVQGSAMPNAIVRLWFANASEVITKKTDVDTDGNWSINVSESLDCGDYKVWGIVSSDGLASESSDIVSIVYCSEGSSSVDDDNDIDESSGIQDWISVVKNKLVDERSSLIPLGIGVFLIGLAVGLFYARLKITKVKKDMQSIFKKKLLGSSSISNTKGEKEDNSLKGRLKDFTSQIKPNSKNKHENSSIPQKQKEKKKLKGVKDESFESDEVKSKTKSKKATEEKLVEEDSTKKKGRDNKSDRSLDSTASEQEDGKKGKSNKEKSTKTAEVSSESSSTSNQVGKEEEVAEDSNEKEKKGKKSGEQEDDSKKGSNRRVKKGKSKLSREQFLQKFKKLEKESKGKGPTITLTSDDKEEDA